MRGSLKERYKKGYKYNEAEIKYLVVQNYKLKARKNLSMSINPVTT